jgi:hypothetical protein
MDKIENKKISTDDEICQILSKKLSLIDKNELIPKKVLTHTFLILDADNFEDIDDKLTPQELDKILQSKNSELLLQQNAYIIKNTIIKEGTTSLL